MIYSEEQKPSLFYFYLSVFDFVYSLHHQFKENIPTQYSLSLYPNWTDLHKFIVAILINPVNNILALFIKVE